VGRCLAHIFRRCSLSVSWRGVSRRVSLAIANSVVKHLWRFKVLIMATVENPGDSRRDQLRKENGFHDLVLLTTDKLTLKRVEPGTEALYGAALHEWDL